MIFLASIFYALFCFLVLMLIGAFSLLGMQQLIGSKWMEPIVPLLRRLLSLIYPVAGGFVIAAAIVLGFKLHQPIVQPLPQFHDWYLSPVFFVVRGFIYLAIWGWFAQRLKRQPSLPGALILIMALFTGSFATFDWMMSLEPEWKSTAIGLIAFVGGGLLAHNTCVFLRLLSPSTQPERARLADWNNFQFALVGVWTYLITVQWITVWSANLPHESAYYIDRSRGTWLILLILFLTGQSVFQIPSLLFRGLKQSVAYTRRMAIVSLISQFFYLLWVVGPALTKGRL